MPIFAGPTGGWPAFLPNRCWRRTSVSNALLLVLAVVSYSLGDMRAAIIIVLMVLLAIITAFIQEHRSNEAAARLHAMVKRPPPGTSVSIGTSANWPSTPVPLSRAMRRARP